MSLWKLILRTSIDLSIALAIGSVIWLPFLLFGPIAQVNHEVRTQFAIMPVDDRALDAWIHTQPGVDKIDIRRVGKVVELRYSRRQNFMRSFESLSPPWSELGYVGGPVDLSFNSSFSFFDSPLTLFALILCSQAGFLIIGIRRVRAANRTGETIPSLLAGASRSAFVAGLAAGVGLLGLGWLYSIVLEAFGVSAPSNPWGGIHDVAGWAQVAIILFGALVAPVCEEIFFRGVIFGSFWGAGYERVGAVVSAAAFGLVHFDLATMGVTFLFGLVLAWVYHRTHSILAPIVAHAINNGVAFGLLIMGG
ncbi:CPBP family intramembrane metalloprotease [Candidatus Poribacteria bacterium]|nr:CPBP family intramembrane metalloprotease [Candidatus Poribacteria bacterium]